MMSGSLMFGIYSVCSEALVGVAKSAVVGRGTGVFLRRDVTKLPKFLMRWAIVEVTGGRPPSKPSADAMVIVRINYAWTSVGRHKLGRNNLLIMIMYAFVE